MASSRHASSSSAGEAGGARSSASGAAGPSAVAVAASAAEQAHRQQQQRQQQQQQQQRQPPAAASFSQSTLEQARARISGGYPLVQLRPQSQAAGLREVAEPRRGSPTGSRNLDSMVDARVAASGHAAAAAGAAAVEAALGGSSSAANSSRQLSVDARVWLSRSSTAAAAEVGVAASRPSTVAPAPTAATQRPLTSHSASANASFKKNHLDGVPERAAAAVAAAAASQARAQAQGASAAEGGAGGAGAGSGLLQQWQEHAVFAGNAPGLPPSPDKVAGAAAASEAVNIQDIDARLENLQAFLKNARG